MAFAQNIGGPKSLAAPEKTNFLGFWSGKTRAQGRFMKDVRPNPPGEVAQLFGTT